MKNLTRKIKSNKFSSLKIEKDNFLGKVGIFFLVLAVIALIILFFPPAQSLVINFVALMLNTLVLSNIFLCNIIVIAAISIALIIVLYIFKKIK